MIVTRRINGLEFPLVVSQDDYWENMHMLLSRFTQETGCLNAHFLYFFSSEPEVDTEEKFTNFFKDKLHRYWKQELYGEILPMFKVWLSQFEGQPITLDTRVW